jgi:hypothetical protein
VNVDINSYEIYIIIDIIIYMKYKQIIVIALLIGLMPFNTLVGIVTSYEDNPDFNKNYLISDDEMIDYTSMSIEEVRDFTEDKGGVLDTYVDPTTRLSAYYVIWQAAQVNQINPKFILALLQKEQSLVTENDPSDNQLNWATGYSCYGGVCLDKYKGFSQQVNAAARRFRNYFDDLNVKGMHKANYNCTFTKWCVGLPKTSQDLQDITPQTKATAALYTYNPYQGNTVMDGYRIGANYNFWKIWNNWFEVTTFRPNGTLLKASNSDKVYLIKNNEKRPFASFSALITRYDPKDIIIVSPEELDEFVLGNEIKFSQYSILADPDQNIYLLVDDKLRHIVSTEVFRTLGYNPEEVIDITYADLNSFDSGLDLTLESVYPTGALIQDATTNGIYYVKNGIKYPIVSIEILNENYPDQTVMKGHTEELAKYPKGAPVKFKDNTLIKDKDEDKVYVVSEGKKYHIKDGDSFTSRGYNWDYIVETSTEALSIHPTSLTLDAISNGSSSELELIEEDLQ